MGVLFSDFKPRRDGFAAAIAAKTKEQIIMKAEPGKQGPAGPAGPTGPKGPAPAPKK